jgi:hypothetical protein
MASSSHTFRRRGDAPRETHTAPHKEPPFAKALQKSFVRFEICPPSAPLDELVGGEVTKAMQAQLDELAKIGEEVIAAKTQLDAPSIKPRVEGALRAFDMYRGLRQKVERDYNMQHPSNASLKIHEIITQFKLLDGPVKAFCAAELPGGFIFTINHHMKTVQRAEKFDWAASSYYPEDRTGDAATILDDRYGLLAGTRDHWLLDMPRETKEAPETPADVPEGKGEVKGEVKARKPIHNNGDLTKLDNILDLAVRVLRRFDDGATLYTSDAGIDVTSDYNRQEELTSTINLGQTLTGIMSLAPGGAFVTKTYTVARPFTASLLAAVAGMFGKTYVCKPKTSRAANSEIYVVGLSYKGGEYKTQSAMADVLSQCTSKKLATDFPPFIAGDALVPTLAALVRAMRDIHGQQVRTLGEVVRAAKTGISSAMHKQLGRLAHEYQAEWLRENFLARIETKDHLPCRHGTPAKGGGLDAEVERDVSDLYTLRSLYEHAQSYDDERGQLLECLAYLDAALASVMPKETVDGVKFDMRTILWSITDEDVAFAALRELGAKRTHTRAYKPAEGPKGYTTILTKLAGLLTGIDK